MQLSGLNSQGPLRSSLTRFDRDKITIDVAIRNTIGVALPLILGDLMGNPAAGALGALGALNVASSDSRDPYVTRGRRMMMASLLIGLATAVGAFSANNAFTAVTAVTLGAFAAGMMVVLGQRAADLGVTTLVTLVIFAARPMSLRIAIESGSVALAGGLLHTLLSVAVWPLRRYQPERRTISALYGTLSDLAVSHADPDGVSPETMQIARAREVLASVAQDHSAEGERDVFLLSQAERIRLSLLTIRRLSGRLGSQPGNEAVVSALDDVLRQTSTALRLISRKTLKGDEEEEPIPGPAAADFRNLYVTSSNSPSSRTIRDAAEQIETLGGEMRAASLTSAVAPRETAKPWQLRLRGWRARVLANLSLQSTACRHAIRLAVCVGLGDALGRSISLGRTYWVPMTIAIILKPDFGGTFSRGILRLAGTFAGLLIATALFHFIPGSAARDILLVAVFTFLMRSLGLANYGIFVTALSALVVALLAVTGFSPRAAIVERALNTAIGGAVALLAYWLWPTWEQKQTGPALADLIDAYRGYFDAVVEAWENADYRELDEKRSRARVERVNAEAFVARIAAEPGFPPEGATLLNAILVSFHGFVRAAMSLESALYLPRPKRSEPAAREFARETDETLSALITALRTSQPLPQNLPDLRAAHNRIEDRYGLVCTETDRMVTCLNTAREQIQKLTALRPGRPTLPFRRP